MFDREAKLPVDLKVGLPATESRTIPEHIRQLWDNYEQMYAHMRKNDQVVIKRNAHQYQGGEYKEITEGGLVWYFCPKQIPGKPTKLTSIWMGPFRVVEKIPPNLVKITAAHTKGREITVSVSRLKI